VKRFSREIERDTLSPANIVWRARGVRSYANTHTHRDDCWFFSQNGSAAAVNVAAAEDETEPPPTLMDRVSGVVRGVKQHADETLDEAGNAASVLDRLQPAGPKRSEARNTENRLVKDDALGRLQETKGRTVAAAKRVMDETIHKLQTTVDDIKRTVSGDDEDDAGGDRRISHALDSLFRAVGSEGKAAFEYASEVINETADRAKAAVEKAQQQQKQRKPQQ